MVRACVRACVLRGLLTTCRHIDLLSGLIRGPCDHDATRSHLRLKHPTMAVGRCRCGGIYLL
eukprot:12734331-Alexandrium_andersonii.AAC.1